MSRIDPLIAVCTQCARPFTAGFGGAGHLALGTPGSTVFMEEVKIGADPGAVEMSGVTHSCPYCGGEGRIPDGLYNFLGDGLSVLRSVTPTNI